MKKLLTTVLLATMSLTAVSPAFATISPDIGPELATRDTDKAAVKRSSVARIAYQYGNAFQSDCTILEINKAHKSGDWGIRVVWDGVYDLYISCHDQDYRVENLSIADVLAIDYNDWYGIHFADSANSKIWRDHTGWGGDDSFLGEYGWPYGGNNFADRFTKIDY